MGLVRRPVDAGPTGCAEERNGRAGGSGFARCLPLLLGLCVVFCGCFGGGASKKDEGPSSAELAEKARAALKDVPFDPKGWETNTPTAMGSARAVRGGTLRWPIAEYPATLRPWGPNSHSVFISMVAGLVWESLIDIDPLTLEPVPVLADYWKIGDDKKTFWFHINPKAKWADGTPVTALDVVETWKLLTDKVIKDPFANMYYSKFEEPVAESRYVVRFKAKKKEWRSFMACGTMSVYPAHEIMGRHKKWIRRYNFKMMTGTGPYELKSTSRGNYILMKRRNDWWADSLPWNRGLYNFDMIKFVVIKDENLMIEKFKKGELDWYLVYVARRWAKEFVPERDEKIAKGWIVRKRVYTDKPQGVSGYAFNLRVPPFNDKRVRMAFAYLQPREQMIEKLFFNQYIPTDSLYPNSVYANPNNPKVRYNPEKAAELLEEAGYRKRNSQGWLVNDKGEPLELTLLYASKSSERIHTVYQQALRKAGINLKLKLATQATIWKLMHEFKFKITQIAWSGLLFPNPESSYHSKLADKKDSNNIFGLKDPKVDELIERYNTCFDINERISIMRKLDGILFNHYLYALGWYAPYTRLLFWNKFGYPDYMLSRFSDYRSIVSLWWFDPGKKERLKEAMRKDEALLTPEEIAKVDVKWWDKYKETGGRIWKEMKERDEKLARGRARAGKGGE